VRGVHGAGFGARARARAGDRACRHPNWLLRPRRCGNDRLLVKRLPLGLSLVLTAASVSSPRLAGAQETDGTRAAAAAGGGASAANAASASPASPSSALPAPSASSPSSLLRNLPALVTGGAGVVALGVGAVFGVLAWQDHEDFQSHPRTDTANRGESRGLTADMCFGGAATLAVASLVMFFTHPGEATPTRAEPAATSVVLAPFAGAHGAGAAALVRF